MRVEICESGDEGDTTMFSLGSQRIRDGAIPKDTVMRLRLFLCGSESQEGQ